MKRESWSQRWMGMVASMLVLTMLVAAAPAQGPAKPSAKAPAKPAATSTTPARKKPRGRLPAYFGKVVSAKQRDQIYSIQAKYNAQIEKLQAQLKTLIAQRDGDVEQVLSTEQRAEVQQLREQRKARGAAAKARKAAVTKPASQG